MKITHKENNSDDDNASLKNTNRSNMNISRNENSKTANMPNKVNERNISPILLKNHDQNEKNGLDASIISHKSFLSDKIMEEKQLKDQEIIIQQLIKDNQELELKVSKLEHELIKVFIFNCNLK